MNTKNSVLSQMWICTLLQSLLVSQMHTMMYQWTLWIIWIDTYSSQSVIRSKIHCLTNAGTRIVNVTQFSTAVFQH